MGRILLLTALVLCGGGAFSAAQAQKTAPMITRDSDHDGVPDLHDRCRNTPIGTHVDATGCPVAVTAPAPAPTPAPAPPPAAPASAPTQTAANTATPGKTLATPPAVSPQASPGPAPATHPSGLPNAAPASAPAVTPPVTVPIPVPAPSRPAPAPAPPPAPPAAPAAVTDPTMTAGFWMPTFNGTTMAQRLDYSRTLALRLDSAVVAMVDVFRNTSGTPIAGATSPNVLSAREKRRWQQCRLITLDLITIGEAATTMRDDSTGISPALNRATSALADAFEALQATSECDNVGSMIDAPDRWAPWQSNYESSARNFYKDWYGQLRAVHEADRGFARALMSSLPQNRQFPVPSGLPPTPPTIGAVR